MALEAFRKREDRVTEELYSLEITIKTLEKRLRRRHYLPKHAKLSSARMSTPPAGLRNSVKI